VLEAVLRAQVRRHGIVMWLDGDDHYTPFVDALAAREDPKYEVRALRGSYLALMLELEALTGGVERPRLVVHLPGFNEEAVKATPLYELYAAGVRFRKALPTLVNEAAAGKVRPEALAAFTAGDTITLEAADAWLTRAIDADEGALASQLRAISLGALLDDLLSRDGYVASRVAVDAFRHADGRHELGNPEIVQNLPHGRHLPLAAIDQDDVRPGRKGSIAFVNSIAVTGQPLFADETGEAALHHLAHHAEIVTRGDLGRADIELPVLVFHETFRTRHDHRAHSIGAHDVRVVVDFDTSRRSL